MIIAIDPGNKKSALVIWDEGRIGLLRYSDNEDLMPWLRAAAGGFPLVIEQIKSYGMAVGESVFETCVWTGRFMEAYGSDKVTRVPRTTVKVHHCHSAKAKDANVRQALIDRFGGKDKAIGTKKSPGPLWGVTGDLWAALAVALWYEDTRELGARNGS